MHNHSWRGTRKKKKSNIFTRDCTRSRYCHHQPHPPLAGRTRLPPFWQQQLPWSSRWSSSRFGRNACRPGQPWSTLGARVQFASSWWRSMNRWCLSWVSLWCSSIGGFLTAVGSQWTAGCFPWSETFEDELWKWSYSSKRNILKWKIIEKLIGKINFKKSSKKIEEMGYLQRWFGNMVWKNF